MRTVVFIASIVGFQLVATQVIYDIWQTTWDRTRLLTRVNDPPVKFVAKRATADADITVGDDVLYQQMDGFGATLTDSSAFVLNQLKSKNPSRYDELLNKLFDVADQTTTAGFGVLRLSLGASDFSPKEYSFDDVTGDTSFSEFSLDRAPPYLWSTLADIIQVNPDIKLFVVPWSPPAWMKSSLSMKGGTLQNRYTGVYANYLFKVVQQLKAKGFEVYAISPQNEPEYENKSYPTTIMPYTQEADIGRALRALLDDNGFESVRVIGYEHNWDHAGQYPVSLMRSAEASFAGVAFHCYVGDVANQEKFHSAFPGKEVYMTECADLIGDDWWEDIKRYTDTITIGAPEHWSRTGMMWNLASDSKGGPKLPGTESCGGSGCRALVQINSSGSYTLNQEFYIFGQASRAIVPKDPGGPAGQRIGVSVGGNLAWALRVIAFVTKRTSDSDWNRYSLVVLNWRDGANSQWNPQPVRATIEFRDVQATYTFPVGITTLWWFAAA